MDAERWQRVNALFHAALERAPAERDAFLDEVCAGDPALRAEVTSLVASHRPDDFLEVPAAALDQGATATVSVSLVGRRLGQYEITAEIGRGGMGVVYLGRDARLNRPVAIKALAPEFTRDARRRARLEREARASAALSHPGIATVYALEEHDTGLFIVGEYVRGETLREELVRGPLALDSLVDTALAVARALAAAHAQGVIHRDLKPENVIRAADGGVKILDFGLARFADSGGEPAPPASRLTETGTILGTPAYMSPEQLRGWRTDFRTDLFSFGAMVYELATGAHPFAHADPISTIARILNEEPAPVASRATLPPALAGIIDRCLRKAPAERYAATAHLVSDLERLRQELAASRDPARAGSPLALPSGVSGFSRTTPYRFERRADAGRLTPQWWWHVHQAVAGIVPSLLLLPLWQVQSWTPGAIGLALFVTSAATAVALATLRFHLWFTSRFYPNELRLQRARARPWILAAELLFVLLLLGGAAVVAADHRAFAALLGSASVALAIASAIIEPATTRAAFGADDPR